MYAYSICEVLCIVYCVVGVLGMVYVYVHVVCMVVFFFVCVSLCVCEHTFGGQRTTLGPGPSLPFLEMGSLHCWPLNRQDGLSIGLVEFSCFYLNPSCCRNDEIANESC